MATAAASRTMRIPNSRFTGVYGGHFQLRTHHPNRAISGWPLRQTMAIEDELIKEERVR